MSPDSVSLPEFAARHLGTDAAETARILEVLGLQAGQTIPARELEVRIRERIPDVSVFCTNCTSSSPSGWEEYRKAIAEGLWPDDAG